MTAFCGFVIGLSLFAIFAALFSPSSMRYRSKPDPSEKRKDVKQCNGKDTNTLQSRD